MNGRFSNVFRYSEPQRYEIIILKPKILKFFAFYEINRRLRIQCTPSGKRINQNLFDKLTLYLFLILKLIIKFNFLIIN